MTNKEKTYLGLVFFINMGYLMAVIEEGGISSVMVAFIVFIINMIEFFYLFMNPMGDDK